jgi:hypothetical protein
MTISSERSPTVDRALGRRDELLLAIGRVERVLSAPAAREGWLDDARGALSALKQAFHDHLHVTEGEDGLFADVLAVAPRLAHQIDQLRFEHDEIERAMDDVLEVERADALREAATGLLGRLVRHRQHGADLLFEAYDVDVSVGD